MRKVNPKKNEANDFFNPLKAFAEDKDLQREFQKDNEAYQELKTRSLQERASAYIERYAQKNQNVYEGFHEGTPERVSPAQPTITEKPTKQLSCQNGQKTKMQLKNLQVVVTRCNNDILSSKEGSEAKAAATSAKPSAAKIKPSAAAKSPAPSPSVSAKKDDDEKESIDKKANSEDSSSDLLDDTIDHMI